MKIAILLLTLASIATPNIQAQQLPQTSTYSQKTLLKNWALSICLAQVTQDERTTKDAGSTASAYMEFGKQDLVVYDELRTLVTKYVARRYSGSVPSEFNTMKCIDLFHSKELDRLTTKAVRKQ